MTYEFKCSWCKQWFVYGDKALVAVVDGKEVCGECEKEIFGN